MFSFNSNYNCNRTWYFKLNVANIIFFSVNLIVFFLSLESDYTLKITNNY